MSLTPFDTMRLLSFILLLLTTSIPVHADSARMEMLFERAFNFQQNGEYERALDLYGQARAVEDEPLISLNMAQVYRRLGQPGNALRELERYIETTTPDDPFVTGAQELVPLLEIQTALALNDDRVANVERLTTMTLSLCGLTAILLIAVLLRQRK